MKLIAGRQIPVAAKAALELATALESLRRISHTLRKSGLHEGATLVDSAGDSVSRACTDLESAARNSFAAARRGEPLPSGGQS